MTASARPCRAASPGEHVADRGHGLYRPEALFAERVPRVEATDGARQRAVPLRGVERLERRVDERAQRRLELVAGLGDQRVNVPLAADRAQLRGVALVDRERLADEPLDALGRLRGVLGRAPAPSTVGERDDLHGDLAAGGDELVERAETAVDGPHADARASRDVVPARRRDALLAVELAGRVDDPLPVRAAAAAVCSVLSWRNDFLD